MLSEIPISRMRQAERTTFWELGRKVSYTWQQVIVGVEANWASAGASPIAAAAMSFAQAEAISVAMSVDFDNPPVPWFNCNNNKIFINGVPAHPSTFAPPPYMQTIFGADGPDIGAPNGFQWFPTDDRNLSTGDIDLILFHQEPYAFLQAASPTFGPVALVEAFAQNNSPSGGAIARVTVTRLRVLAVPSSAPLPLCVSTFFQTQSVIGLQGCGQAEGSIFSPQAMVFADPLPSNFSYSTEVRVWAPSPIFAPCKDCQCP